MTEDTQAATEGTAEAAFEQFNFEAEVNQILHLVVHSLYSNKEIFLRELISNASDAIDKRKFAALSDKSLLGQEAPAIRLIPGKDGETLTIEDDGIGMSHDELIKNLGTIAHSGTQAFLKQAASSKQQGGGDVSLIGQFGVGFYSAFLVADRVTVTSRAAGSDEAWRWSSTASESFSMAPAERETVGTTIVLHLNEEQRKFGQDWQVRHLVTRYSDFVSHPIRMQKEIPAEEEGGEPTKEWETINQASALWIRPKAEITQEQYDEFYEHLSGDYQGAFRHIHFQIEGIQMFTGLLYLPQKAPWDINMREFKRGVRLYVKRVFIMEDAEELVPPWLRFIRGVVDSNDLPLNVSRELLQDSAVTRTIKKQVIKKSLDMIETLAKDEDKSLYESFWTEFGATLKEGLHFDPSSKDRLAKLVRFRSTRGEGWVSLEEYKEAMPEGQSDIFYVIGTSLEQVKSSPHIEGLRKKGYEVLFMTDTVDEWAVGGLPEFDGCKLVSALQADLEMDETDEQKKAAEEQAEGLKGLTDAMGDVLSAHVSEVRASNRLTDSPACLVTPPGGLNAHFERLLRSQNADLPESKRIFEINPNHVLVERLKALHDKEGASERLADWVQVLYDQALLTEGSPIEDPQTFARRVTTLLEQAVFGAAVG